MGLRGLSAEIIGKDESKVSKVEVFFHKQIGDHAVFDSKTNEPLTQESLFRRFMSDERVTSQIRHSVFPDGMEIHNVVLYFKNRTPSLILAILEVHSQVPVDVPLSSIFPQMERLPATLLQ